MLISTLTKRLPNRSKSVSKISEITDIKKIEHPLNNISEIFPPKEKKKYLSRNIDYDMIYKKRTTYKGIRNVLSTKIKEFNPEKNKKIFNNYV